MEHIELDILVVGGGHAGVEAAAAACQFKDLQVGIATLKSVPIASAPCNPSIGGVGKGQVVKEIDHLGGLMGKFADLAGIQFRTLNESKGYAVQSTRVQIDKEEYSKIVDHYVSSIKNLTIYRTRILDVTLEGGYYIVLSEDFRFRARRIIFTVGTFLNGKLHYGLDTISGGRHDSESSDSIENIFKHIKTNPKRFKTGTPPRLNKNSIDFSKMQIQESDPLVENFHVLHGTSGRNLPQKNCYLAYTNEATMKIIRDNKEQSPMFNGQIKATGARYCPSIEDKAFRYPDKNIHHVFVEPESHSLNTMYPSGISTSLPRDIQVEMVRTIQGLEKAEIEVPGYAVEYDVVDTTELTKTLEHQAYPGLYFAGQVNGTSGYEEAAGQGLVAGFNAALALKKKEPLILSRYDSYIGVMIEDLVSNLRDEPYRLFTARSENRLYVREDNTALRMHAYRKQLGLKTAIDQYNEEFFEGFRVYIEIVKNHLIDPRDSFLADNNISIKKKAPFVEVLKLSIIDPVLLLEKFFTAKNLLISKRLLRCIAITCKYEGYIDKSKLASLKIRKLDEKPIRWVDLKDSENISFECKQRIAQIKPETFGQLRRIEGIRQATLSAVANQYF